MTEELALLKQTLRGRPPKRVTDHDAREAAVAIILAPVNDGGFEILFIRRAEHETDPWSGHMALPGGRRDATDKDLLDTARRETMEEVGILLPNDSLLGELDDLHPRIQALPNIVVRPFVFALPERQPVTHSNEVALHVWLELDQLRESRGSARVDIRGAKMSVDAFLVEDHVIWGITHRILTPLLDLL